MESFDYYSPKTLEQAFSLLDRLKNTKILAGGTDLLPQIKKGQLTPAAIIDIKKIPELNHLELTDDGILRIGASVSLSNIVSFLENKQAFTILYHACSLIGAVQTRNRGTMGGNICNAAPSADSAPPLVCLEASVLLKSKKGQRRIKIQDFFLGPGKTALQPNELLLTIEVPTPKIPVVGCYLRHIPREEMDISVAGAAVMASFDSSSGNGRDIAIALGAVAPVPIRIREAENFLTEKPLNHDTIRKAAVLAGENVRPISDTRASAEYRRQLVRVLVQRALTQVAAAE